MLRAIRGKAGSWIVKILFAFLILSFAVWGIGDIFRGRGPDQTAAEVGEVEISVAAVDRALRQNMDRMRQVFGPEFGVEQAVSLGLLDQAVDTLVAGALLDQAAADLGLLPPDSLVAEEIRRQPVFQDPSGRFDRNLFLRVLAASGLSEEGYVALLRRDLARARVAEAVGAGAAAPPTLTHGLYRYRQETRTAAAIGLPSRLATDVPTPTEPELRAFHQANGDLFRSPEYRALTVVTLDPQDLADEIAIGEDTLRAEYDARLDEYQQPETRRFDQVVVQDRAVAEAIAEAARGGRPLDDAVAAADGVAATVIPLDWTTRDTMLPQLGEAGFALPEGGVSAPVETPFGWHVLAVTGIRPAGTRGFEEVRDELAAELKLDRALDHVFEVANEFEDALAADTPLEQAAQQFGLTVRETAPLARSGAVLGDAAAPDLPAPEAVLGTAFALSEGQTSSLEDTPEGLYYAVRVDEVVEPTVRPFEEVRDQVADAWTRQRRADAVEALAAEVAERLRNGEDPQAVAAAIGAEHERTPELLRDGSNRGDVPPALVERLFGMTAGEVAVVPAGDGQIVAKLVEVTPADPAAGDDALATLRDEVERRMAQDLTAQFTEALRQRYGVEINRSALEQIHRPL